MVLLLHERPATLPCGACTTGTLSVSNTGCPSAIVSIAKWLAAANGKQTPCYNTDTSNRKCYSYFTHYYFNQKNSYSKLMLAVMRSGFHLETGFSSLPGIHGHPARVRHTLVETLFLQPLFFALIVGSVTATCLFAATLSQSLWQHALTASLVLCLAFRLFVMWRRRPGRGATHLQAELLFAAGAFAFATIVGAMAFHAMIAWEEKLIEVILVTVAVMYGLALSMRYCAIPYLAIGQMVLSVGPPIVALLMRQDSTPLVLAIGMAIVMLLMSGMNFVMARVFRHSLHTSAASQRIAARMQNLARTDVLTGLANRAGLTHLMAEQVMGLSSGNKLALFWLDLDRFKEVNDTMGHPVGDRVLTEVADRLRDSVSARGVVARFGGDEFILAVHVEDQAEAGRLGEQVLDRVRSPIRIGGDRLQIGASIGIALMPDNGSNLDELMQHADLALYDAKVKGRNRCSFFQAEMNSKLCKRREIEADLRQAIERDELTLFFQPMVDLETGRIRSFEALMRWFHPERGEIRPDEFIPVAEDTGLIITLGNWITQQAAAACSRWPEHVRVAVNLSPVQIRAPGSALAIRSAIRQAGLDPSRMILEVTESLFLEDEGGTRAFIDELADDGIRSRSMISVPAILPSAISTATRSRRLRSIAASCRARMWAARARRSSTRLPNWESNWEWKSWPRVWKRPSRLPPCARRVARWAKAGTSARPCQTTSRPCCWRRKKRASSPACQTARRADPGFRNRSATRRFDRHSATAPRPYCNCEPLAKIGCFRGCNGGFAGLGRRVNHRGRASLADAGTRLPQLPAPAPRGNTWPARRSHSSAPA